MPVVLRVWRWWLSRGEAESRVGAPRDRSCARRERGDRRSFRAVARGGAGCGRSNARSGPIPLPPVRAWWVAICWSFGIGRLGLRFVDGLRFLGGVVLRVWRWGWVAGGGSAGSVLRSQGTLGQEERSRCRADGIRVSTFQCSLRPDPAAAGNHQTLYRRLERFGWRTSGGLGLRKTSSRAQQVVVG